MIWPFVLVFVGAVFATQGTLLKPWPSSILINEIVEFRPIENHHFKLEAPQKCESSRPLEMSPRFMRCQFLKAGPADASFSVCDDKETYCRPEKIDLNVGDGRSGEAVRLKKNEHLNQDLKKDLVRGFVMGTPEEMRTVAKKNAVPVLVMISTDWCPPCNEAKEYLLKTKEFEKITAKWTRIYVDGDNLEAAKWGKVVPFRYYPTFALLNGNFEEVARFNEELRAENFVKWAEENEAHLKDPIVTVKARVLAREKRSFIQRLRDLWSGARPQDMHADEVRVLKWAFDQEDGPVIKTLLEAGGSFPELETQILRHGLNEMPAQDKKGRGELYGKLLEEAFKGEDWAETLSSFCEEDVDGCKLWTDKIQARIQFLKNRSGLSAPEKASQLGEEYLYIADVYDKLNVPAKAREFADKCIGEYRSMRNFSSLKTARGATQNSVPCLEMANRFSEAKSELQKLIAVYPNEPTFLIRLARVLRAEKKFDEALAWVDRALDKAYGYNWITAMLIKSDILLDLKKKSEARAVIDEAIQELRLEKDPSSRNQLIAKRLRAAATKIEEFKVN